MIPHPKDGIQVDYSELPEDEVLNFIAKAQQSQLFKPSKKVTLIVFKHVHVAYRYGSFRLFLAGGDKPFKWKVRPKKV